jgi:predicted O-methyltransferase YrrM
MEIYKRLLEYIKQKTILKRKEGNIDETQINFFVELLGGGAEEGVKKIGETGFNMGHSALTFLSNTNKSKVYSFDCNRHEYTMIGKEFIDNEYPDRLHLICGDSTKTLPDFIEKNKKLKFDLIFIDGGHSYKVAKADLENMKKLANSKTILVIDDILPNRTHGKGPTKALDELVERGDIINVEYYDNYENKGKITRRWVKANYSI